MSLRHHSRVQNPSAGADAAALRQSALVLVSHGASARVRLESGEEVLATLKRRGLQCVCGDEVACESDGQHTQWQLSEIKPRRSALYRSNARGRGELVAANVTLLVIVIAPRPQPDLFVVDRYLAAAASARITTLLLANKADQAFDAATRDEIDALRSCGCETLHCSAQSGAGLDSLRARLRGETVMLVGQSGVGKSSLLRQLVPGSEALVGELLKDDEGRHTTSAAQLYALPGGGSLIDSPGVRDFAPAVDMLDAASLGFAEIAALAPNCRFADCVHLREPQCAVRAAVESGAISARRYESYRRLRRLREQLLERIPHSQRKF